MDIAHVVQSSVAPVFLLTGVASTLGVLTNRLARLVDRARSLEAQLEREPARRGALLADLRVMERRARYINTAITMCTVAALLVALVVVSLFADAFLGLELAAAVALLFVAAMLCLAVAYIAFFVEVRIAVAALRIGIPNK
jgi:CBS domain containing-hemolysin-like protein